MKISDQEIKEIHEKLGIHPLPDDYKDLSNLKKVFGDQTLFLTADGLHIWEYAEVAGAEGQVMIALNVASWANGGKTDLSIHKPQLTDVTVKFDAVPVAEAVNS